MSKRSGMRCPECGRGTIHPTARPGRKWRYKTMALELPAGITVPTCDHCGEEWLDESTAQKVDTALERRYRERLRELVKEVIDAITGHNIAQRRVERILGLSAGYLSKLRNGDRDPSAELVSELALLSREPKKRLRELEEFWGADDTAA